MQKGKAWIAIDGGATTGIAIWDGQNLILESGSFCHCLYYLDEFIHERIISKKQDYEVLIEDPNLNQITFRRESGRMKTNDRKARNVGMNMRDAQIWIEWCQINKFKHRAIKPLRKTNNGVPIWKGVNGKITQVEFEQHLGISIKTNQHCRDACLILSQFVKLG